MTSLNAFAALSQQHCNRYFSEIEKASDEGRLTVDRVSYPTNLIVYETPSHFLAELVGDSQHCINPLPVITRRGLTVRNVLGSITSKEAFVVLVIADTDKPSTLENVTVICRRDIDAFGQRYAELIDMNGTQLRAPDLDPNEAFESIRVQDSLPGLWLHNVLFTSSYQGVVRARYFQNAWTLNKDYSSSEMKRLLQEEHPVGGEVVRLAAAADEVRASIQTAANFASISFLDKMHETTITDFVRSNESILTLALGGIRIIAQPIFEWLEGNPEPTEKSIQPDFLLIDSNNQAHICDFKLPLIAQATLTAAEHKRRRLIYSVLDGVSQLANYQEYFTFGSHRQMLLEQHGVSIDSPRSILIVGSSENFDAEEVRQAKRALKEVEIVDFDTLRSLYLIKSGVFEAK